MGLFDKIFGQGNTGNSKLDWKSLKTLDDLEAAIQRSYEVPVGIFKHSTRCSISAVALSRLERGWDFEEEQAPEMYYLDLIAYREVSNAVASKLGVHHESPQLILIKDGQDIYDASHSEITVAEIHEVLEQHS